MPAESWQFAIETLPERPVQQAGVLLSVTHAAGSLALVLDLATDEFVRVPGLPRGPRAQALCMARDGSQIIVLSPEHGTDGALCLHTLATGHQTWFHTPTGEQFVAAARAPDGHQIVALCTADDPDNHDDYEDSPGLSLINVIDVATHQTRRMWQTSGGCSQESTIAWSPDGTLLAATYFDPEQELASVVINAATGTEIARYPGARILGSPSSTWHDDHDLIYLDTDFQILVADLDARAQLVLGQVDSPHWPSSTTATSTTPLTPPPERPACSQLDLKPSHNPSSPSTHRRRFRPVTSPTATSHRHSEMSGMVFLLRQNAPTGDYEGQSTG